MKLAWRADMGLSPRRSKDRPINLAYSISPDASPGTSRQPIASESGHGRSRQRDAKAEVSNFEQIQQVKILIVKLGSLPTREPFHTHTHSKMVLCIDDNQEVLECDKAFLGSFGYTVLTAPSGHEGLELASIHSVDGVIVDYFMPEMNGQ